MAVREGRQLAVDPRGGIAAGPGAAEVGLGEEQKGEEE